MRFEWDPQKNTLNRAKHGVSFEIAARVFEDPLSVTTMDATVDDEDRWHTIGKVNGIVLLLVVHTVKDDSIGEEVIRIISARKATPPERRRYEQADR